MQLSKNCGKSFLLSEEAGIRVQKSCEVSDSCLTVTASFHSDLNRGRYKEGEGGGDVPLPLLRYFFLLPSLVKANK